MHGMKMRLFASLALLSCSLSLPAQAIEVLLPARPADNLDLTLSAIARARRSLKVNIYQLSSAPIVAALKAKIENGIHVQILEEGQPVGGLSATEKAARDELAQSFASHPSGQSFFREMSSHGTARRRFRFDHAKYVVADEAAVLIGSENYTDTGNPDGGAKGNRGWEVIVNDPGFAEKFSDLFAGDANPDFGDVLEVEARDLGQALAGLFPGIFHVPSLLTEPAADPSSLDASRTVQASAVEQIVSPTTSLDGLTNLIRSAKSSIDLEQMTFASSWSGADSPLLEELLAAARRGVKVRVLLNDERAFGPPHKNAKPTPNVITNELLNRTASQEGLDLESRIANVAAMGVTYIHNKGALVDGKRVLVSSINWNQNSVEQNREAAVVVEGAEAFGYHEALFQKDWSASAL